MAKPPRCIRDGLRRSERASVSVAPSPASIPPPTPAATRPEAWATPASSRLVSDGSAGKVGVAPASGPYRVSPHTSRVGVAGRCAAGSGEVSASASLVFRACGRGSTRVRSARRGRSVEGSRAGACGAMEAIDRAGAVDAAAAGSKAIAWDCAEHKPGAAARFEGGAGGTHGTKSEGRGGALRRRESRRWRGRCGAHRA